MAKILIVSDAWEPQVNGVVRTLQQTRRELIELGHEVGVIGPGDFLNVPMPGYTEIRLAVLPGRRLRGLMDQADPDAVHISTEGPLGMAARRWCKRRGMPFSSSFHTRFAEYSSVRMPIPESWVWWWLRRFHREAAVTLTATQGLQNELCGRGFARLGRWSRGVDLGVFYPTQRERRERPVLLYMGRVAPEKNLEDFLRLKHRLDAEFHVVGDGPSRAELQRKYPQVKWHGYLSGAELNRALGQADCFVFPSRTDTFGLVMLEAMATGTPVAAYPEQGPLEVIDHGVSGAVHDDLFQAVVMALRCDRGETLAHARGFSWKRCTQQFEASLVMQP